MNELVLFCGGPAIYPGNVPKPLQEVAHGRTLLHMYLDSDFVSAFQSVTLLCEELHVPFFEAVIDKLSGPVKVSILETPNQSSTLIKLDKYLECSSSQDELTVFSYPDIFFFGSLTVQKGFNWSKKAMISISPLTSRFPRITVEPFTNRVRSISTHQSAVPANPVHLFGGHLLASPNFLADVLSEVVRNAEFNTGSLEFDVFSWMISRGQLDALPLEGTWLKADGPRDLREIHGVKSTTDITLM